MSRPTRRTSDKRPIFRRRIPRDILAHVRSVPRSDLPAYWGQKSPCVEHPLTGATQHELEAAHAEATSRFLRQVAAFRSAMGTPAHLSQREVIALAGQHRATLIDMNEADAGRGPVKGLAVQFVTVEADPSATAAGTRRPPPTLDTLSADDPPEPLAMAQGGEERPPADTGDADEIYLLAAALAARPVPLPNRPRPTKDAARLRFAEADAKAAALREGLTLDADTLGRAKRAFADATDEALGVLSRRALGDYSPDEGQARYPQWVNPHPTPSPTAATPTGEDAAPGLPARTVLSFDDLWREWVKAKVGVDAVAASTLRTWRRIITKDAAAICRHRDPSRIGRADVLDWIAKLRDKSLSPKTINNKLTACKAVFKFAAAHGLLPGNPFADAPMPATRRRGRSRRERDPQFTAAERTGILTASLLTPPDPGNSTLAAAKRWLPWLMCYSGLRVASLCQLRKQDIKPAEGFPEIMVMRLTLEAGSSGKSGRPHEAPLHPSLIKLACCRFRGHREKVFHEVGGGIWRDEYLVGSSRSRRFAWFANAA